MEPQSAGQRSKKVSAYRNRWASCEHGKRNSRVCVECWEALAEGRVVRFSGKQNPSSFDVEGVEEYQSVGEPAKPHVIAEEERKNSLLNELAEHIRVSEHFGRLPAFGPAIDQRDHEWKPKPKVLIPMQHTEGGMMSPAEYASKEGWRR